MRTWTRLVPAVLLILPFTPALLRADEPQIPVKKEDFQKLLDKVDKLQSDITASNSRGSRTAEELRAIRDELGRIRELLERMAQQGVIQRQAGYAPGSVPSVPGGAIPTTGTITVENMYSAPADVRINGQSYPVGPFQTRPIIVPLGAFQYSVNVEGYGMVEPPRTETLRAGYRIRIFPRMP